MRKIQVMLLSVRNFCISHLFGDSMPKTLSQEIHTEKTMMKIPIQHFLFLLFPKQDIYTTKTFYHYTAIFTRKYFLNNAQKEF